MSIEEGAVYLSPALVLGIGSWKEYLTIDGVVWEARKFIFPFCIAMKFKKIGKLEEE